MSDVKQNNGGYSLVELVVAIVIIALVVGPILHAFFNSARLNGQSEEKLRATTVAQNIMEEVKGTEFDFLISASSPAVAAQVDENLYCLTFDAVQLSGREYTAVVRMNASQYKAATGEAANYNDIEQPEISKMDSAHNGFYVPGVGSYKNYAEDFNNDNGVTNALDTMEKITVIDIEKASSMETAKVSVRYEYNGDVNVEADSTYIYRDTTGEKGLRGVYIYFEPMYNAIGRLPKEKIIINNTGLLPVNVYLVKQHTSEYADDKENNYAVDIQVNEPGRIQDWVTDADYKPLTVLRSNLTEDQMLLSYTGAASFFDPKFMLGVDDLAGGAVKNKLYKVEVIVYDEDNKEQARLTGTKEN